MEKLGKFGSIIGKEGRCRMLLLAERKAVLSGELISIFFCVQSPTIFLPGVYPFFGPAATSGAFFFWVNGIFMKFNLQMQSLPEWDLIFVAFNESVGDPV